MNMLLKSSAAIAAVPVAAPVIASADVATHATARVVEPEWPLANELKSLFVEFFELAAQRSKLHAEAKKAASVKGRIDEARWDEALEQNGYCQCARQVSKLLGRMRKLSKKILALNLPASSGIRAAAFLVSTCPIDVHANDEPDHQAEDLVWELAASAGFAVPEWMQSRLQLAA
jgi:hypothetical protein